MLSITCPRCHARITTRGVSHSQPGLQWECRGCGCIVQDDPSLIGPSQRAADEAMFDDADRRGPRWVPLS